MPICNWIRATIPLLDNRINFGEKNHEKDSVGTTTEAVNVLSGLGPTTGFCLLAQQCKAPELLRGSLKLPRQTPSFTARLHHG
jgi:hypothetical protein